MPLEAFSVRRRRVLEDLTDEASEAGLDEHSAEDYRTALEEARRER